MPTNVYRNDHVPVHYTQSTRTGVAFRREKQTRERSAIISLKNDRETSYKAYISVQNELVAAYNELRNREYLRLNPLDGMDFTEANRRSSDPRTTPEEKERLRPKLRVVKDMFPQKLSEAEPSKK